MPSLNAHPTVPSSLLTSTPRAPARTPPPPPPSSSARTPLDDAFEGIRCSGAGRGQVRRFADDNVGSWNMVLDLARSAKRTLDFSFFTIEQDPYGYAFLGAALHAQLRGVQVQGMVDWVANARGRGFTSYGFGYDYLEELAAAGARLGVFNTPTLRAGTLLRQGPSYGVISSNHDKALVIDRGTGDAQGATGGRNIAAAYHQDPRDNPKAWRDDTLQLKGKDACAGLATAIERELSGSAVSMVTPDLFNASPRGRELLVAYAMMEEWVARAPLSATQKAALRSSSDARSATAGRLVDAAVARADAMIGALPASRAAMLPSALSTAEVAHLLELAEQLTGDLELCGSRSAYQQGGSFIDADVKIIDQTAAASAAPGARHNEMADALLALIRGAQREIVIQNPYVVLTEEMVRAFEDAAARGVSIRIVTNSPMSTDSAVTQGFFLNDFADLLARVPSARIFVATGERKMHAKAFVVDGKVAGDTSYNADLLSGLVNGEIGAITRSAASAQDLLDDIEADLRDPSNGFREWSVKKDAAGRALLGADGKPIIVRGPSDDVPAPVLRRYRPMQLLCTALTWTPAGAPLAHPPLAQALAAGRPR